MLLFGAVYVYLFIPETKGLSLEEVRRSVSINVVMIKLWSQVDEMYRSGVLPWNSSGWQPSEKHIHDKAEATEVREVNEKKGEEVP